MTLNSDSKSKRSLKSISPNPSSSGNNSSDGKTSNKKTTTAQKTLGMAWGASSRSSSRSAFRNSPFSDFGSYMAVKNHKLHEQFNAAASSSSHSASGPGKSIFSGVSIFVDGYTVPSSQELRGYMLKYGGRFENYFSRQRVTHIICSNLPDSKIKNLRAFSGGLPVVKPEWVMDSVAANKLLSWIPYQLDQLATENNDQPKLSTFFTPKTIGVSEFADLFVDDLVIPENENQSLMKAGLSEYYACLEEADKCNLELDDLRENICTVMSEEPACSVESSCEVEGVELTDHSFLDGKNSDFKHKSITSQASGSLCSNSPDTHNVCEASSSRILLPPNQRHSTLSDPNFVENYFKSSRLHFIGTWRNRYRKRFPSLSDGFRQKNSSCNTAVVNEKNAIIHMDMDCFFVSVVIRNHPELLDKPVAVCHSDNPRGTAEISSANYSARDHGVKAGMFVKDAKVRCPQLVIVPYDFGAYETVADQFYDILHRHCNKVQAVSCDEAFLDVSESEVRDPQLLASIIRKELFDTTGCTASAGISGNMLMARLATRTAKPNGQCYIPFEEVDNYLHTLPVKALPGIGHVLEAKLKQKQIETCGQLCQISKESLQKDFGMKTGEMLCNYSRGIDNRLVGVVQESKSVGAEVNWGVRFRNLNDIQHFLTDLCKEVALRLQGCGVQGRAFTLKIKKKRSDAGEPVKYMGHGDCENLSHTITIPMATDDVDVVKRLATQLFGYFYIDVKDIRGVGLQVSKLEGADDSKLAHKRNSILPWLVSTSKKSRDRNQNGGPSNLVYAEAGVSLSASLPPLQDLDMVVLESLPPEVVSEINDMYGGKLLDFISKIKNKTVNTNINATLQSSCEDLCVPIEETESLPAAHLVGSNTIAAEMECDEQAPAIQAESPSVCVDYLLPSSLSQVDFSVLQQLPDELRKDIIELLPQHREPGFAKGSSSNVIEEQTELSDLWSGSPPKWVEKFQKSNCSTLNNLAMIHQFGSGGCLSSLLQRMMSRIFLPIEVATDVSDDAVSWLCELFKQYVDLKIATDIEEIYFCMCLLKRLSGRSEFFLEVFNIILPHLQVLFTTFNSLFFCLGCVF
ncbi:DNA repair protein rev1 [Phtheirospermum japonicum]|uniref:DNA repair protein REV1 n=1 Tax=Phtheirospermum japonicum TaxID=374723 RepID=A0A830DC10_9LAMI|nr:DNA repair protein rev1 [Phtheirospermum japonicum]